MALHYKEKLAAAAGLKKTVRKMLALALALLYYSVAVYARFSAGIANTGNVIRTTTYSLEISVTDPDGEEVNPTEGVYQLEDDQSYTVKLTAAGGASTGYCVIRAGERTYYTDPITKNAQAFTIIMEAGGDCTFTAVWGRYSGIADLSDGDIVGKKQLGNGIGPSGPQADETDAGVHIVQSGDTLWDIAGLYGTTVEQLAADNGIETPDNLQIGQEIKISAEEKTASDPAGQEASVSTPDALADGTSSDSTVREPTAEENGNRIQK